MNGHFEIDESSYPIGALVTGTPDKYKVFDMPSLTPLHSQPISKGLATTIASRANACIRGGEFKHGSTEVQDFVQAQIEVV